MLAGYTKVSYIDYPGELSSVIFLSGCNFKCPWCHNKDVVNGNNLENIDDILVKLETNKKLIEHVVITGGEPTLYGDKLTKLMKQLKEMGFKIKLDTNGTHPELLQEIILGNLVDYIAMDIKNTWDKYNLTTNTKVNIDDLKKSIAIIENSGLDYQFRTTCNKEMHTIEDINVIKGYLKDNSRYKLQNYKYTPHQINDYDFGSVDFIKKDE